MARTKSVTEGYISTKQFFNRFPNEKAAREHIERLRWGDEPVCPHCGGVRITHVKNEKPQPYRCKDCRKHFSVRTGTIFHSAKLSLQDCLYAIYLVTVAKKGISSCQLARELGITQKSAWFLEHRIRAAYENDGAMLSGTVEVDETYIGGRRKNMSNSKRKALKDTGRGGVGKQAVVGMRSRESKQIVAMPINSTNASALQGLIHAKVERGSTVYTDDHKAYMSLDIGGVHRSVKHSIGEYVREQIHTNGIESFWALLKRGYMGTFHKMSFKHLHRYVNEFAVRYNRIGWDSEAQIDQTVRDTFHKRLGYRGLVNGC